MKRIRILIFLFSVVVACSEPSINSALRDELLEMGRQDQEVRERMIPLLQTVDFSAPPSEEWIALVDEQNAIDQANTQRIEAIVGEFGWPGPALVGHEASQAAQTILQHSKLDSLKRLVPIFREAVLEGQADRAQLAMVEDQIRVEEGQNQLYGTEVTTGPDGITRLYPLDDPDAVDKRRKEVGLGPLEEYLNEMEKLLGLKIQR